MSRPWVAARQLRTVFIHLCPSILSRALGKQEGLVNMRSGTARAHLPWPCGSLGYSGDISQGLCPESLGTLTGRHLNSKHGGEGGASSPIGKCPGGLMSGSVRRSQRRSGAVLRLGDAKYQSWPGVWDKGQGVCTKYPCTLLCLLP